MKKLALILLGVFLASPAVAQNVQCTTRPLGDSTNACASTAFVQNAINSGTGFATLAGNNIFTGFNTFAPLAATNPAVTINPLAGSVGQGLIINLTPAGTVASTYNFLNGTFATNANVNAGVNLLAFNGTQVTINGSSTRADNGAFSYFADMLVDTISSANNQSFAAILARGIARVSTTVSGAGLGGTNCNVGTGLNVTGWAQITCHESDVTINAGSNPLTVVGYTTVLGGTSVVQGSIVDTSFYWTTQVASATLGWKHLFLPDWSNGKAIDTTGDIFNTRGTGTIGNGFVIGTGITVTGDAFKSTNFAINGSGDLAAREATFTHAQAGASLVSLINANAAGQSIFQVKTNSANNFVNFGMLDNAGVGIGIISAGSSVGTILIQTNAGTSNITVTKAGGVAIGTAVDCGANCLNSPSLRVNNVPVSTTTGTVTSVTCSTGLTCTAANPIVAAGTIAITNTISAGGPTGSATVAPIITYNAQGQLTVVSSATITPAASSITGGAALTKTDDTNVTLALGGTPTTALLQATSITVGWSGQLSVARGGTNCSAASITCFNNITGFTSSGATGTTSSNLVFSASPTFTGTIAGTPTIASAWTWSTAQIFPTNTAIGFAAGNGAATGQQLLYLNGGGTSITDGGCIFIQLAGLTQGAFGNNDACLGGAHTADMLLYAGSNAFRITSSNFNLTSAGAVTFAATVKTGGYTVATLPAGTVGMTTYVTDADACTFLTTVVHTVGAVTCPVFYDGTTWKGG